MLTKSRSILTVYMYYLQFLRFSAFLNYVYYYIYIEYKSLSHLEKHYNKMSLLIVVSYKMRLSPQSG